MPFEILQVKTIHDGWARYLIATVRCPDGRACEREIEDHGTAACVLPYDAQRRTAVFVKQFRAPAMFASRTPEMLEAIAGTMDEDDPAATARREAREEGGLRIERLEPVGTVWTMPGISTERMSLFLAPYTEADRVGDGGGLADEHEQTTVVELSLAEVAAMADAGTLNDMKTMLLVQSLRLRRPELFPG